MTSKDSIQPSPTTGKMCKTCGETKSLDRFTPNKKNRDRLNTECKECRALKAKVYYQTHKDTAYARRYHPPVPSESGEKVCPGCKEAKDYSQFSLDKTRKDGYRRLCKKCNVSQGRKSNHKYRVRRLVSWESTAKYLKISIKQAKALYDEAFASQKGKCAICGEVETRQQNEKIRRLSVDHCHTTGEFRGLLCASCNLGLGSFKDNPETLQKAIAYLQRHRQMA